MRTEGTARWSSRLYAVTLVFGWALSFSAHAELASGGSSGDSDAIDRQQVRESVIGTVKVLNEVYVYPDVARRVSDEITRRLDDGLYDRIASKQALAERIGSDLQEVSGDGHLGILLAEGDAPPTHVVAETVDRFRLNYAFQKVEVLDGNIGYLKLNKFYLDDEAQPIADHALGFLSGTDALIIDLTECVGGSPELVRHMLSYFFSDQTLLWSIINRDGVSVYDALSTRDLGPARFKSDFPVFILTSPDTASAAEMFTYALQSYGKAKTVGEGTMGIAHVVGAIPINEHFVARFSTYRSVNPITNSDWERVGVVPDTYAAPEDRLDVAVRLAKASLERNGDSGN